MASSVTKKKATAAQRRSSNHSFSNAGSAFYEPKNVQNYHIGTTQPLCYLRVRPLFLNESLINKTTTIQVLDKESLIFTSNNATTTSATHPTSYSRMNNNSNSDIINLTREKLFRCHRTTLPDQLSASLAALEFPSVIDHLLFEGISHAFLALGGASSGKTHTLFGTLSDPGLLIHFVECLFTRTTASTEVHVSFSKFTDDFYDLLSSPPTANAPPPSTTNQSTQHIQSPSTQQPLQFKTNKQDAIMPALTSVKINSQREFFVYLNLALQQLPSRDFSRDSYHYVPPERCHAIVTFKILHRHTEPQEENPTLTEEHITESEMVFIDCEHIEPSEKMEHKVLHQSLITLENIMQYVYEINQGLRSLTQTHLPYDQSKFTQFFRHFLFGKNQLIVFGALSPFKQHYEDSAKTARLVQWAYGSKNPVQSNLHKGTEAYEKTQVKDVAFLRKIHHTTNVLNDEMKSYVKNTSVTLDDKAKYTSVIKKILSEQQSILLKNLKLTKTCVELRESLATTRKQYLHEYFEFTREFAKHSDIRELYMIRYQPQPSFEFRKHMDSLQAEISNLIAKMTTLFARFSDIQVQYKALIEEQSHSSRSSLRSVHYDSVFELSHACSDYLKYTQTNTIRSFQSPNPSRYDAWNFETSTKILSLLEHLMNHLTIKSKNNNNNNSSSSNNNMAVSTANNSNTGSNLLKRKQTQIYKRVPSEMALHTLKTLHQIDFKLVDVKALVDSDEPSALLPDSSEDIFTPPLIANKPITTIPSLRFLKEPTSVLQSNQLQYSYTPQPIFSAPQSHRKPPSNVMAAFQTLLQLSSSNANQVSQSTLANSTKDISLNLPNIANKSAYHMSKIKNHNSNNNNNKTNSSNNNYESKNTLNSIESPRKTGGNLTSFDNLDSIKNNNKPLQPLAEYLPELTKPKIMQPSQSRASLLSSMVQANSFSKPMPNKSPYLNMLKRSSLFELNSLPALNIHDKNRFHRDSPTTATVSLNHSSHSFEPNEIKSKNTPQSQQQQQQQQSKFFLPSKLSMERVFPNNNMSMNSRSIYQQISNNSSHIYSKKQQQLNSSKLLQQQINTSTSEIIDSYNFLPAAAAAASVPINESESQVNDKSTLINKHSKLNSFHKMITSHHHSLPSLF